MESLLTTLGLSKKGTLNANDTARPALPDRKGRRMRGTASAYRAYLFCSMNAVIIAMVLFDTALGAKAGAFSPQMMTLGRTFTDFGKSGWILFLSAYIVMAAWAASRTPIAEARLQKVRHVAQGAAYIFVTVAASGLAANLLKRIIGRARPDMFSVDGIFSFDPLFNSAVHQSFPSGHATTAGALFIGLALLFPRFRALLIVAGLWLGFTRVIVGAHYPSDAIAGLAFGAWFSHAFAVTLADRGILFKLTATGWPIPDSERRAAAPNTPTDRT